MYNRIQRPSSRSGVMAPLIALMITPLVGMMAFSVDIGYLLVVRSDLQNAADSAALAGAQKLQDLFVSYNSPGQTQQASILTTATTNTGTSASPIYTAEKFAKYNKAGGVYINVPDSDVQIGFTDGSGNYSSSLGANFPNTITVTTRRSGQAGGTTNGTVQLFFGRVFGVSSEDLSATARATIYTGAISSYQPINGVDSHVLPVGLDYNAWTNFYSTGMSPDGTIHLDANGLPQLQIYPIATNTPGNFGLLDVGPPSTNAPAFRDWINDGETPNDISYLLNNNQLPVTQASPKQWTVGPGIKSTLLPDFQGQLGKANLIPLFRPYSEITGSSTYQAASGTGSGANYYIVGFVGVKISQADGSGNAGMTISIQPTATIDATSMIPSPTPAGTQSMSWPNGTTTSPTTFISAKLTQ
jgi:Flp pilus assembly protein TadG